MGETWEGVNQKTLPGDPHLASTAVLGRMGLRNTPGRPRRMKPARSLCHRFLTTTRRCSRIPAMALQGCIPPRRLSMPTGRGHALTQTLQPSACGHTRSPVYKRNLSCTVPPPSLITNTNPKRLRLLQLPSLPLCELVQRRFYTLTTTKPHWVKTTHYGVPPRLAPRHKPVHVKWLQSSPSSRPRPRLCHTRKKAQLIQGQGWVHKWKVTTVWMRSLCHDLIPGQARGRNLWVSGEEHGTIPIIFIFFFFFLSQLHKETKNTGKRRSN